MVGCASVDEDVDGEAVTKLWARDLKLTEPVHARACTTVPTACENGRGRRSRTEGP